VDAEAEQDFREFVAARWSSFYRAALLLTGQREAAEDLVQTALARAADRWKRLDQPEPYIRRIMYHQQVSRWRLRSWGRERSMDAVPDVADSRDATGQAETRLSLIEALRHLSPLQRAVIVLRFFEDLPDNEIASTLGISAGAVRSHSHRALAKLRAFRPELALNRGDTW
jgi:RNA polymerase sigma-70 factor (sigma-E family)